MTLRWNGDKVLRKMIRASVVGVNRTMAESVGFAKSNHPWTNRTGTLERGTRVAKSAFVEGEVVSGLWGVVNVLYGKYLERNKKWRWLTPAALEIYPKLKAHIRMAFTNG